jgi:hypothetical protein
MAIIQHTPALIAFIVALQLALSAPQREHVLNVVEGLIVGQGRKTLSDLCRLRVGRPDPKTMADTFRESPWTANMIRLPLRRFLVKTIFGLARAAEVTGCYRAPGRRCSRYRPARRRRTGRR